MAGPIEHRDLLHHLACLIILHYLSLLSAALTQGGAVQTWLLGPDTDLVAVEGLQGTYNISQRQTCSTCDLSRSASAKSAAGWGCANVAAGA